MGRPQRVGVISEIFLRIGNSSLVGLLIVAVSLTSCEATYRPTLTRLDPVGVNSRKASAQDLIIYVEEYASTSKSERAFDANLSELGILPFLVLFENRGKDEYDLVLVQVKDQFGRSLRLLTPNEAATKAKRGFAREAIGWSLVVPIITIPVAAGLSVMNAIGENSKISQDFNQKGMGQEPLEPGKRRSGFLFYQLEQDRKNLSGLIFDLQVRNKQSNALITTAIPFPDVPIIRD